MHLSRQYRAKQFLFGLVCLGLLAVGVIWLLTLIVYSEFLRVHMPEILAKSGASHYDIERYWTDANFVKVRDFGLLASFISITLGTGLWLLRVRVFAGLNSVKDRLRRLLVIVWESKSTKFDHYSGFALLGSAVIVSLFAIFTLPVRCDES